jgi:SH3 domain protein
MNIRLQIITALFLILFLSSGLSAQETQYVTDRLKLGLFEDEKASGKRIESLESGAILEVLDKRRNFAKVRTPDGNVGWVKSAYLVGEKPAVVRLTELESEYQRQALELDEMRTSSIKAPVQTSQKVQSLEKKLHNKETELKNARLKIDSLIKREPVREPKEIKEVGGYEFLFNKNQLLWYLVGILLVFISGTLLGIHIVNDRLRKRFYGFTLG